MGDKSIPTLLNSSSIHFIFISYLKGTTSSVSDKSLDKSLRVAQFIHCFNFHLFKVRLDKYLEKQVAYASGAVKHQTYIEESNFSKINFAEIFFLLKFNFIDNSRKIYVVIATQKMFQSTILLKNNLILQKDYPIKDYLLCYSRQKNISKCKEYEGF